MRDLPSSRDLLALARELLLDELLPLLPPERERDARLIATAMAIAARKAAGLGWEQDVKDALRCFYDGSGGAGARTDERQPPSLMGCFAADLRNGAFETSPSREAAARVILWRLTIEKLREGNPHFLAANGLRNAGGRET